MTKVPSSDCSSSLSDGDYDQLSSTFAKLRAVINQEASLRKDLVEQFKKRKEDAHIAVRNAQRHLELVKTQEANMLEILEKECAAAHAIRDGVQNIPEDRAELSDDERKFNTSNKHDQVKDRIGRKPIPNILSPTNENPPNLNANEPKSPRAEDRDESAAEGINNWVTALAKATKGTAPNTPAAKRAKKTKKPNLLPMPNAAISGHSFTSSFDPNTHNPSRSPARSTHGIPNDDNDETRPPRSPARSLHGNPDGDYDETRLLRSPAKSTHGLENTMPARSPARSTHGLFDEPPRSPARSMHAFEPPRSPARSACAFGDEPTRSPATSTRELFDEPIKSPARSTRGLFGEPPKSPARSTHAFEPPRSPARSARGVDPTRSPPRSARGLDDGPIPISPAQSNRGLSKDTPLRSPARSTRGLEDSYLSPDATSGHPQRTTLKISTSLLALSFGDNYGSGIQEPKKSPARHSAALPATLSLGDGGFGTSPTANTSFGFGAGSTANIGLGAGAQRNAELLQERDAARSERDSLYRVINVYKAREKEHETEDRRQRFQVANQVDELMHDKQRLQARLEEAQTLLATMGLDPRMPLPSGSRPPPSTPRNGSISSRPSMFATPTTPCTFDMTRPPISPLKGGLAIAREDLQARMRSDRF